MKNLITTIILFISLFSFVKAQKSLKSNIKNDLSITQHKLVVNGESINYTATAGYLQLKSKDCKPIANMFFVAYVKKPTVTSSLRPITFVFNGGPGSSSLWLHMGAIGPKRIPMLENGEPLPPPYKIIDNEYTWLDKTDIVFIDPINTGYSRPVRGEKAEQFLGYENDISSIGEFIRLYISQNDRWNSPKFVAGESYGTTRAAGLSGHLQEKHGIYINGVMLLSTVLNYQTITPNIGNDLPYPLILPSLAATAWYHKKLNLKYTDLSVVTDEAEKFATSKYLNALQKGDMLTPGEKEELSKTLSGLIGLDPDYLKRINLRPYINSFNKALLKSENKVTGRLDSRFTGTVYDAFSESVKSDPSYNRVILGAYSTTVNDYIGRTLNYKTDLPYEILNFEVYKAWDMPKNSFLDMSAALRKAMTDNHHLKVWISSGYYDLATPYFATEYTINHLFLEPKLKKNITTTYCF